MDGARVRNDGRGYDLLQRTMGSFAANMGTNRDARDRTLGIQSLWDLARKLSWELHLVDAIPDRVRVGQAPASPLEFRDAALYGLVNAALTSLAMLDWLAILTDDPVYGRRLEAAYPTLMGLKRKRRKERMRELVPMLQVCHQIGNAFKHRELATYDFAVKVHPVELVFEDSDGSEWITYGGMVLAGIPGNDCRLDQALCDHCDWWCGLLRDLQLPDN